MLDRARSITRQKKKCPAAISSNSFCGMVTCGSWVKFMNRLLIPGILIISTAPLFAQTQQPNAAELAQKVVSIISGDKAKIQTYCQILDLSDELDMTDQQKDRDKTEELSQKINALQKKLGPEYLALLKATEHVDPNSKDGQEIVSTFVKLDNSCGQR
jgi:flagellar motility protein MotE (MotC chaperone)